MNDEDPMRPEAGEPTDEADLLRLAGRMRRRIAEAPDHPTSEVMRRQLVLLDRILALSRGGGI